MVGSVEIVNVCCWSDYEVLLMTISVAIPAAVDKEDDALSCWLKSVQNVRRTSFCNFIRLSMALCCPRSRKCFILVRVSNWKLKSFDLKLNSELVWYKAIAERTVRRALNGVDGWWSDCGSSGVLFLVVLVAKVSETILNYRMET